MNFLKSAASKVTSAASKVGNFLSGGKNTANASASLPNKGLVSQVGSNLNQIGNQLSSQNGGDRTLTTQQQLSALSNAPTVTLGSNAPGVVPQVYPGSTGAGSNQNVSTGNFGGYTPAPRTISAGKTPIPSSAYIAPNTISSDTLGSASSSSLSGDTGGSTSRAITLPSAGVSNPGIVSNAGLVTNETMLDPTGMLVQKPIDQERANLEKQQNTLQDWLVKNLKQEEIAEDQPEVREQQNVVNQRQQEVNEATARLNAIVAKQQQDLLSLREVGSREGVTEAVYGGQQAQINYEAAVRAIPIQAQVATAQGNLELAQDYLRQVTTITQKKLDSDHNYYMALYNSTKDFLSGKLKDQLEELEKKENRAYAEKTNNTNLRFKYSTEASQNGQAGLSGQIASLEPSDPNFTQNLGFYVGQIEKPKSGSTTTRLTPGQQSDPFLQKLVNTSGGKAVTDNTIQKLDKGLTVLGQLGVLQANLQGQKVVTEDGVELKGVKTGPLVGAFRSANPWDTQAQVIKNQLNAIVPNLARGVYGEVGVLTDNDIATYSKTIPNLKSTEEVRNAVLYITLDMIGKSFKNTLDVNASAGRDVSGFVDIYAKMEDTKNSVLSTIPGAQVPQAFQGGGNQPPVDANDPLGILSLP